MNQKWTGSKLTFQLLKRDSTNHLFCSKIHVFRRRVLGLPRTRTAQQQNHSTWSRSETFIRHDNMIHNLWVIKRKLHNFHDYSRKDSILKGDVKSYIKIYFRCYGPIPQTESRDFHIYNKLLGRLQSEFNLSPLKGVLTFFTVYSIPLCYTFIREPGTTRSVGT